MANLQGQQNFYYNNTRTTRVDDGDDEFCLEKELDKLKSQKTKSSSTNISYQQPQLSNIFHINPNPIPTDIHFQVHVMDETRRVRNQEILAKLQELQINASIYEARSDRLRVMRKEYETLVQKYSSQQRRMYEPMPFNDTNTNHMFGYRHIDKEEHSTTTMMDVNKSHPFHTLSVPSQPTTNMTLMMSTGVNTDITGPVVKCLEENETNHKIQENYELFPTRQVIGSINNSRLLSKTFRINEVVERSKLSMPNFYQKNQAVHVPRNTTTTTTTTALTTTTTSTISNRSGDRIQDKLMIYDRDPKKKYHHFMSGLDLSTSESDLDLTVTRDSDKNKNDNRKNIILNDETFSDSFSFTISNKKLPDQHLLSLTEDDTDSISFSITNLNKNKKNENENKILIKKNSTPDNSKVEKNTKVNDDDDDNTQQQQQPNTMTMINNGQEDQVFDVKQQHSRQGQGDILSDSQTSLTMSVSATESFIDSNVQNKTPDSLPRDESELQHIYEEEQERVHTHHHSKDIGTTDINKNDESDPEGTQTDGSISEQNIPAAGDKEMLKIKLKKNDENFQNKIFSSDDNNKHLQQILEKDTNINCIKPNLLDEKKLETTCYELKKNESKESHVPPPPPHGETSKEKLELQLELKNKSFVEPMAMLEQIHFDPITEDEKSKIVKTKRHVRLKLDYEDSESEGSDSFGGGGGAAATTATALESTLKIGNQWKNKNNSSEGDMNKNIGGVGVVVKHQKDKENLKEYDDDFDDFFDI